MKPSIVIAALLLASFRWSSGSNRVEVAPGEDAVLTCRNVTGRLVDMFWARLVINGNYSCVASNTQTFCSGIRNERFETSSNKSSVSLKVKDVKVDDSGFYFCVFNLFKTGEIELLNLSMCVYIVGYWISVALGGLCVLLLMAIVTQHNCNVQSIYDKLCFAKHSLTFQNLASNNLNYATVNFQPKARRTRRAFHNEPNVIYAATR
uniref:Ig-like domain-containing protein n=1 Tax=Neogobius melanostomus TaxID=47308 RepID=A0A8C6US41_9GOBI